MGEAAISPFATINVKSHVPIMLDLGASNYTKWSIFFLLGCVVFPPIIPLYTLFGVGGTPTTLWRTPCTQDAEVAARLPPKSLPRVEESFHVVLPTCPLPCGKSQRGIETRWEVGTRNREGQRGMAGV